MLKNFEFFNSILNKSNFLNSKQNLNLFEKKFSHNKITPIKIPSGTPKNNGPFSQRIERSKEEKRNSNKIKNGTSNSKKREIYTKKLKDFFPIVGNKSITDLLNEKQKLNLTNIAFYNMYTKYESRKYSESNRKKLYKYNYKL